MKLLVIAERKKHIEPFLPAFESNGFEVNYLRILKISLVSKHRATLIKSLGKNIPKYDAVFLHARASLAPFVEPLLEEFSSRKIYSNSMPGSYYIGMNEPFKFTTLALGNVPIPDIMIAGSSGGIKAISRKGRYPLMVKALAGKAVQQKVVVNNAKEFEVFLESTQDNVDAFILHEYDACDVITCAVIGEKVFAVKRKLLSGGVSELKKGKIYKLSDAEKGAAIKAAQTCGYDIAQIEMSNGKILDVRPNVNWKVLSEICSENLEEHVARFFAEKLQKLGVEEGIGDEIGIIRRIFSKTIFRKWLK
jgi:hypothetical protein